VEENAVRAEASIRSRGGGASARRPAPPGCRSAGSGTLVVVTPFEFQLVRPPGLSCLPTAKQNVTFPRQLSSVRTQPGRGASLPVDRDAAGVTGRRRRTSRTASGARRCATTARSEVIGIGHPQGGPGGSRRSWFHSLGLLRGSFSLRDASSPSGNRFGTAHSFTEHGGGCATTDPWPDRCDGVVPGWRKGGCLLLSSCVAVFRR
jgi:hypothetical protein